MPTLEERKEYYSDGFDAKELVGAMVASCEQGNLLDVQALFALGVVLTDGSGKKLAGKIIAAAAATAGSLELVRLLLDRGADANALDASKNTPLIWATWHGEPDTCALLLDRGAQIDYMNEQRETALIKAIKGVKYQPRCRDVIKVLLARKANPNLAAKNTAGPLHEAIDARLEDVVRALLDAGADANQVSFGDRRPLLLAVKGAAPASLVKLLLDHGADANGGVARMNWYPLGEAIERDLREVASLLLAAGARIPLVPADVRAKATPEMATLLAGPSS